jgi:phenylacetate-CoA ligase
LVASASLHPRRRQVVATRPWVSGSRLLYITQGELISEMDPCASKQIAELGASCDGARCCGGLVQNIGFWLRVALLGGLSPLTLEDLGQKIGGGMDQRQAGGDDGLRRRHVARFEGLLPGYVRRIDWPADRIGDERLRALRRLLATAAGKSPWHRQRLAGVDVAGLSGADVAGLPVMTKADLMDNFDDVITDRRITRKLCERYLQHAADGAYLLGEYRVVASGGSSGRRGIFVYGWDAWAICWASMMRFPHRDWASDPPLASVRRVAAVVAAARPAHVSAAFRHTFSTAGTPEHLIPVSQPTGQIVAALNRLQPTELIGFSSVLPQLAQEAQAGRLRIAPRRVMAISEPLLPEARAAIRRAWHVPVGSRYGMSEGVFAGFCGHASHLPDDLCLFEPVDAAGRPVPDGVRSQRVYVTNLYNLAMPLIRYEITDEVTVLNGTCPCGSAFRRIADPQGRLDDTFTYPGGISIHPHLFRSALGQHQQVIEYQVHQTTRGAAIHVVTAAPLDTARVATMIQHALAAAGLEQPEVSLIQAASLDRQATGKLKRFIPLPSQ